MATRLLHMALAMVAGMATVAVSENMTNAEDDLDISSKITCTSGLRPFNPRQHKSTYKVAVDAIRGLDEARDAYNEIFQHYLTETAGRRFDPPIQFEMIPVNSWDLMNGAEAEEVDFFFANPGLFTCVGINAGAQPLVTATSRVKVRGHTFDLDVFGGVIATREDRDDIDTIYDLKGKIIGAQSIAVLNGGQTQFYEMVTAGMSYVMDPKQVVFTYNQNAVSTEETRKQYLRFTRFSYFHLRFSFLSLIR